MPDKGGDNVKNKQICPYCGMAITSLESRFKLDKFYEKKVRQEDRFFRDEIGFCKHCHNIIYDKRHILWNKIYIPLVLILCVLSIIYIFPILDLLDRYDIDTGSYMRIGSDYLNRRSLNVVLSLPIYLVLLIIFKNLVEKRKPKYQYFAAYDQYRKPVVFKSDFLAHTSFHPSIPAKQSKKEFVKDNILQISANSESEYIILTKADFETGKCEATFPAMKKENGLALLEKYSEFELSNGEEVLGTLKVEKVFDA